MLASEGRRGGRALPQPDGLRRTPPGQPPTITPYAFFSIFIRLQKVQFKFILFFFLCLCVPLNYDSISYNFRANIVFFWNNTLPQPGRLRPKPLGQLPAILHMGILLWFRQLRFRQAIVFFLNNTLPEGWHSRVFMKFKLFIECLVGEMIVKSPYNYCTVCYIMT